MENIIKKFPDLASVERVVKLPELLRGNYDFALSHIAMGCWDIVNALAKRYRPGSFIKYIMMDQLTNAMAVADELNQICIWSYVNFIYNEIPAGLIREYRNKG